MGHRLSKIYTRTGDSGTTGLGDGKRVEKDSLRVEAVGTIDELNCLVGTVLAHQSSFEIKKCLTEVQHDLFDLGGELCIPGHSIMRPEYTVRLENWLDSFNTELPPLKEFILPGGNSAAAQCHLARAVCRRAERRVTSLKHQESINEEALIYLNRLSDLLFVIARALVRNEQSDEVLWQSKNRPVS